MIKLHVPQHGIHDLHVFHGDIQQYSRLPESGRIASVIGDCEVVLGSNKVTGTILFSLGKKPEFGELFQRDSGIFVDASSCQYHANLYEPSTDLFDLGFGFLNQSRYLIDEHARYGLSYIEASDKKDFQLRVQLFEILIAGQRKGDVPYAFLQLTPYIIGA
jgi:hypothetical protein